jgi:hypothetical protein
MEAFVHPCLNPFLKRILNRLYFSTGQHLLHLDSNVV